MVHRAAGNYRFREFAKIGFPCQFFLIGAVIIIFALEDTVGVAVAIFFVALAVVIGGAHMLLKWCSKVIACDVLPLRTPSASRLPSSLSPSPSSSAARQFEG